MSWLAALPACSSQTAGNSLAGADSGGTWIDRTAGTASANLPWADVASDSTGGHLVAVTGLGGVGPGGDIWTSADAGATWINRTKGTQASGQGWQSVASDSTGTHLVAVTRAAGTGAGGDVWNSEDAGATWHERTTVISTAGFVLGPTVTSDSTGTHLIVAAGDIWTSSDSGATWTDETAGTSAAAQNWVDLASDSTGAHLVAATAYSDIWTSTDSGATWTNQTRGTAASGQQWQAVASDSTGTHLVAVNQQSLTQDGILFGGDIWISTDSGNTWANRTKGTAASGKEWVAAASDATGVHIVAASAHGNVNDIWTTADSGMTWTDETAGSAASGQQWVAAASNATGIHLVTVSSDPPGGGPCCFGDIWTN
jgi:hypothetical protein